MVATLHQPTLYLALGVLYAVLTIVTVPVWRAFDRERGSRMWLLGSLCMGAGLSLLANRGQLPSFYTVVLASTGLIGGFFCLNLALRQLYRLPLDLAKALVVPVASQLGMVVLWHLDDSPGQIRLLHLRTSVNAFGMLWVAASMVLAIWRHAPKPWTLGTRYLFLAMCMPVLMNLLRLAWFLPQQQIHDPVVQSSPVGGLVGFAVAVTTTLVMTYGFLLTLNEQLQIELEASNSVLQAASLVDPLTGIANRRQLAQTAALELARAKRYHTPLAVLVLDLDHFKRINDDFGHAVGDQVLCTTASICRSTLRSLDLVARMGGEEFAILLPQTDVAGAQVLGQRLLDLIAQTQFAGVRGRSVTASLGIAMWQPTDADLDTTMHRADAALYQAKAAGRNCLQVAEDAPTLPAPEPTAA